MSDNENALIQNIKTKGENSYYYAHAPRNTDNMENATVLEGEGIITGGHPVLIKRQDSTTENSSYSIIRNYSWADSDEKVSVYIQFEDDVDPSTTSIDYQTQGFTFTLHKSQTEIRRLAIRNLYKDINPDKCNIKVRRNRVTINLHKSEPGSWHKLNNN